MHIIPVIDLKDGLAVAARQGKRQTYRPLASPLCPQPELPAVIRAYLSVFPFRTFYIADLNAIEKNGNNHALITRMLQAHSDISLWIDSGTDPFINDNSVSFRDRVSNVLGSETGISIEQLDHYTRKSDCILSLDYRGGELLGNPDLTAQPSRLPQRVIVMNLERVGSHAGPDLEHLSSLLHRLPGKQVYAAGGVRNAEDLRRLAGHGVHGALVATALHDRTITSEHLQQFNMDVQDVN
ncbi:MAG: HisA/HisF-related TIM barrel protein [Gammaproteobacteria bacterium]|nr:HisA/HisF-related TIM barrel protein [Gammaproteobacteria bacterium]MDE0283642.1 HisA/HisF-related TIM barrel protein [Gammaproteobacteria bacterium]